MGRKTFEQEKVYQAWIFYKSRETIFNIFRGYAKMMFDSDCKAKTDESKGAGLKILTPTQMLQRLSIVLAQV